jgi:hypothetical protein
MLYGMEAPAVAHKWEAFASYVRSTLVTTMRGVKANLGSKNLRFGLRAACRCPGDCEMNQRRYGSLAPEEP